MNIKIGDHLIDTDSGAFRLTLDNVVLGYQPSLAGALGLLVEDRISGSEAASIAELIVELRELRSEIENVQVDNLGTAQKTISRETDGKPPPSIKTAPERAFMAMFGRPPTGDDGFTTRKIIKAHKAAHDSLGTRRDKTKAAAVAWSGCSDYEEFKNHPLAKSLAKETETILAPWFEDRREK